MGGPNLEVFKASHPSVPTLTQPPRHLMLRRQQFGMYIMFPIAIMYYFGTNLDRRFSVPDFWPAPETTHKIPFERDEINNELARLKARRLERRARRLEGDGPGEAGDRNGN
ncbi:MAG: hypothetical protein M1832_003085 [Thelocarpon impressellum]|nr:MAG: hypothetical protein M1832_003085 [Thelocarpon impressellum]